MGGAPAGVRRMKSDLECGQAGMQDSCAWSFGARWATRAGALAWVVGLSEQRLDALAQALLIAGGEPAEGFAHEGALEGSEHGFDGRGLE